MVKIDAIVNEEVYEDLKDAVRIRTGQRGNEAIY